MSWLILVRSEARKITTTKLHWAFLVIMMAISAATGIAIAVGTDTDGTKGFIATAEDQRSLLAFGANAMIIAGLFGAIATARDYDHKTIVPMFLLSPNRTAAVSAQLVAVLVAGGLLGVAGEGLTLLAALIALPVTDFDFLMPAGAVAQVTGAAALGGAMGAALGSGVGSLLRNSAAAATATVLLLVIAPPLIVQLSSDERWVPSTLLNAISGVLTEPGVGLSFGVLAIWGLAPVIGALFFVRRRDVV